MNTLIKLAPLALPAFAGILYLVDHLASLYYGI